MKWLNDFVSNLFTSDYDRQTQAMKEIAAEQEAKYSEFVDKAREAGFTGPQADFMWTYLSLNNHVHEFVVNTNLLRSWTKPPLNRKNIR